MDEYDCELDWNILPRYQKFNYYHIYRYVDILNYLGSGKYNYLGIDVLSIIKNQICTQNMLELFIFNLLKFFLHDGKAYDSYESWKNKFWMTVSLYQKLK